MAQSLFFSRRLFGQLRRVIEAHMRDFRFPGEYRAGFVGIAAHGHDMVKLNVPQIVQVF